jgi:hypothetical protein
MRASPELARLAACKATVIGLCTSACWLGCAAVCLVTWLYACAICFSIVCALLPTCGEPVSAETADLLACLEPGSRGTFARAGPSSRGRAGNQTSTPCIPRAWFNFMRATKQALRLWSLVQRGTYAKHIGVLSCILVVTKQYLQTIEVMQENNSKAKRQPQPWKHVGAPKSQRLGLNSTLLVNSHLHSSMVGLQYHVWAFRTFLQQLYRGRSPIPLLDRLGASKHKSKKSSSFNLRNPNKNTGSTQR